jgi:hypothetical protein
VLRRGIRLAGVILVLAAMAGCSESSDGVRRKICGAWIGGPADGTDRSPWFVHVSERGPAAPIVGYVDPAHPDISLMSVQLLTSDDCAHGAEVAIDGPLVISVSSEVGSDDHRVSVALVEARRAGESVVVVTRPGRASIRVPFVIRNAHALSQ